MLQGLRLAFLSSHVVAQERSEAIARSAGSELELGVRCSSFGIETGLAIPAGYFWICVQPAARSGNGSKQQLWAIADLLTMRRGGTTSTEYDCRVPVFANRGLVRWRCDEQSCGISGFDGSLWQSVRPTKG